MKTATIRARVRDGAPGYEWIWQCRTDDAMSTSAFDFYYDCITDARKHGYAVPSTAAHGATAPGGAAYGLRD